MSLTYTDMCDSIIKSQQGVLYLHGVPGIGKTALLKYIAYVNDWQYFDFRLSMRDSSEIIGIPKIDKLDTGEFIMDYAIPKTFILANQKPTLIVFEELNRAVIETRNASLQVFLEKFIGNFRINENVYFAATGNLGEEDDCDVEEMDRALWGRLVPLKFDNTNIKGMQEWKDNFANDKVNDIFLKFLENYPEHIYKTSENTNRYTCYRSITFMSNFIGGKDEKDINKIQNDIRNFGHLYLHPQTVHDLLEYIDNMKRITLKDILNNYDKVKDVLLSLNRSYIYELSEKIKKLNIVKLKPKHITNISKFINNLHEDEVIGLLSALCESYFDLVFDDEDKLIKENKNKNFSKLINPYKKILIEFREKLRIKEDDKEELNDKD